MEASICHVVHLVYRFSVGGMENVVLQLINGLPSERFRHTVIALTDIAPSMAQRINTSPVELHALNKPLGQAWMLYPSVYRMLRRLKPDVVHSCNIAALEFLPVAALAGIPWRVHAEHGMDMREFSGKAPHYQLLRRLYRPFVSRYVAVSQREMRMFSGLGVQNEDILLIPNGVETKTFRPRQSTDQTPIDFPFQLGRDWVIGTVGRQVNIKNPLLLVEAFISLVASHAKGTDRARLVMVGSGPLNECIERRIREAGLEDRLWMPGDRNDVPDIMRSLDCFVLPSISEAASCALQEAMATGLPIIATDVGGNADLLEHGKCGSLVSSGDSQELTLQLINFLNAGKSNPVGLCALAAVQTRHKLSMVLQRYGDLFLRKMEPPQLD